MRALILAAGKGTRMKDEMPKVLTPLLGKSFIQYVIDALKGAGIQDIYPIVGYKKEVVQQQVQATDFFIQEELLGTGHAVQQAFPSLKGLNGLTIVIAGDQPLISSQTIRQLIQMHQDNNNQLTLLTVTNPNPYGYGRVLTQGQDVIGMVEEWDATDEQRKITQVNLSVYCFDHDLLTKHIDEVTNNNRKQEYYINDMVGIFNQYGYKVQAYNTDRFEETIGINDKIALAEATKTLQQMINTSWMEQGVTFIDPEHTYIGPDVQIGPGTTIYPNSVIEGQTTIGSFCTIESSYIRDSKIGDYVQVGPFAHIRNQSLIHDRVRIGNFVEVKKAILGQDVKAAHLSYLGDALIGDRTNIGCGVITVNYDGVSKHQTIIKEDAFIGSNVNLIAPITIGKNALVAAGSTITDDVEDHALAIARSRQTIKEGYRNGKK